MPKHKSEKGHKKRSGGLEKVAAHHASNNHHHRKANEKSLKTHGEGYGNFDHFDHMDDFSEHVTDGGHAMKKGGMC